MPEAVDAEDPGRRDSCVVPTAPLAAMLRGFVTSWNVDRPPKSGGTFLSAADRRAAPSSVSRQRPDTMGAIEWLAEKTVPTVSESMIKMLMKAKSETTELRIADPLVTAMGRTEEFDVMPETAHVDGCGAMTHGRLTGGCPGCQVARDYLVVRPNPRAKPSVRARCCGGCDDDDG